MERVNSASGVSQKVERDRSDSSTGSLKQINAELNEQNRKLRQLAEQRSASMANLAHELRTPLTSILGFAEIMLSQEKLTDAQRNFCERIQNSALQLQSSLNKLAELARADGPPPDESSPR